MHSEAPLNPTHVETAKMVGSEGIAVWKVYL